MPVRMTMPRLSSLSWVELPVNTLTSCITKQLVSFDSAINNASFMCTSDIYQPPRTSVNQKPNPHSYQSRRSIHSAFNQNSSSHALPSAWTTDDENVLRLGERATMNSG